MKRLTIRERMACYVLDRADQYETGCASWVGLADAAHGLINGEDVEMETDGQFDEALLRRVRRWKGRPVPSVNPRQGMKKRDATPGRP
jgi:hypothetical protein